MRTKNAMHESPRLVTAEELERFPDDDYRYELVEGRVIRMSPVGWRHGKVVARLLTMLANYVNQGKFGAAVTEVGFVLASNPDTVRAPDVAFVRQERIPAVDPRGFWRGAPDLAVEVLSPDDRASEVRDKVEAYLRYGVTLVLVIDPDQPTVSLHRRLAPPIVLQGAATVLEIDDLVPGFRCTLGSFLE
jgi:Uma2 family endonuclease